MELRLCPDIEIIKNDVLWQPYRKTESESGKSSEELKITGSPWPAHSDKAKAHQLSTLGKQRETKEAQASENERS